MRHEAHFREQDYFKDRWWDGLVYAILDHEWRAQPKALWVRHVVDSGCS
jgi:RimJ/RimL family protein N-acetyltransferase